MQQLSKQHRLWVWSPGSPQFCTTGQQVRAEHALKYLPCCGEVLIQCPRLLRTERKSSNSLTLFHITHTPPEIQRYLVLLKKQSTFQSSKLQSNCKVRQQIQAFLQLSPAQGSEGSKKLFIFWSTDFLPVSLNCATEEAKYFCLWFIHKLECYTDVWGADHGIKMLHTIWCVHTTLNDSVKKDYQQQPVRVSNFWFNPSGHKIPVTLPTLLLISFPRLYYNTQKLRPQSKTEKSDKFWELSPCHTSYSSKESSLKTPSSLHTIGRKILGLDKSVLCPVTKNVVFFFSMFEKNVNLCRSETAHNMILSYYHFLFPQICSCICTQTAH